MANRPNETEGIDKLLAHARLGDQQAENALFYRLDARISALTKRKVWDEEAARDIAQETMRTVFEKYRDAELPRGLLPWVFTILHNKVGNYLKRHRIELERVESGDSGRAWDTVGVSPEGEIGAIDLMASLEKALKRASPECKKIFRLLLSGAGRTNMRKVFGDEPMGTIDSRVSRCRKKLLGYLDDLHKGGGL